MVGDIAAPGEGGNLATAIGKLFGAWSLSGQDFEEPRQNYPARLGVISGGMQKQTARTCSSTSLLLALATRAKGGLVAACSVVHCSHRTSSLEHVGSSEKN